MQKLWYVLHPDTGQIGKEAYLQASLNSRLHILNKQKCNSQLHCYIKKKIDNEESVNPLL